MYSEKKFKNYIFWIQVKRVVLIILFSLVGAGIGIAIGAILKGTINISTYNSLIIIVLTVLFFLLSLLVTSGTGKEVQDGYWKIAVLRKLTAIQKTIESNNELMQKNGAMGNHFMRTVAVQNKEIEKALSDSSMEDSEERISLKKKKDKAIKRPELMD